VPIRINHKPSSALGEQRAGGLPLTPVRRARLSSNPEPQVNDRPIPLEITPRDVKQRLDAGEKLALVDVREPAEFQLARISGGELIPMRTVPGELQRLNTLARETLLVVYCHHGVRSLNVVQWLRDQGVSACQSMAGGIDRWSRDVDPSVALYS
jgi:rhodanese-related sulfurtransferase